MPKFGLQIDGLRAEYNFMSLQELIAIAYKVKTYQISGPDWLAQGQQARFNIAATMPEGASRDDTPAMLQALLQERFKLVAHLTTQDQPVIALLMGKGGPKMKEASGPAQPIDLAAELKPNQTKMDTGDGPMIITRNTDGSIIQNMGAKGTFVQRIDMQAKVVHIEADHLTMDGFADLLTRIMGIGGQAAPPGGQHDRADRQLPGLDGAESRRPDGRREGTERGRPQCGRRRIPNTRGLRSVGHRIDGVRGGAEGRPQTGAP
jgi:uncharacterized protein (TIGR03435 family)